MQLFTFHNNNGLKLMELFGMNEGFNIYVETI